MSITVQIPTAFRRHTAGIGSLNCAAANLGELFSVLDEKFPELKPHLRDEAGEVRRFLNVYVNEEDIRWTGSEFCESAAAFFLGGALGRESIPERRGYGGGQRILTILVDLWKPYRRGSASEISSSFVAHSVYQAWSLVGG